MEAVAPLPAVQTKAVLRHNSYAELLAETKGGSYRVCATNIAYAAKEDEIINCIQQRVGGLKAILGFRNDKGCFNGTMLLEFDTEAIAKDFARMTKFMLRKRTVYLRMVR